MTIKEALKWAKALLTEKEIEGPRASAEFLLRQVLSRDKAYLMAHDADALTEEQAEQFRGWVERRSKHEPVWYITGKIEFGELTLAVSEEVLIPRPETELLIERVAGDLKGKPNLKILDVGTGSGTIILSLAQLLGPGNSYFASDFSAGALEVARANAVSNGLSDLIEFRNGDLLAPWLGMKFDVIVANLPYVPHEDMSTLAFDLTHYEPRLALDGGALGMDIYNRFLIELPSLLEKQRIAYLEIGYNQGSLITKVVQEVMPKANVEVVGDYANIDRIAIIKT